MNVRHIKIVGFESKFKRIFKDLNEEWIKTYFSLEPIDKQILECPEIYILDKGGKILVALESETPVGVCALIKKDEEEFELAKMAVKPEHQGNGIGKLLGKEAIFIAKKMNAKNIFLETNSKLLPAISLYQKLGFEKMCPINSAYSRCDVQMKLNLR